MHIVCEICKSKSPFPLKDKSKLKYCWSHASYSEWVAHIISKVHQENSLTRLHETLAVTRSLPVEEDEDIEICFYPQSLSIVVHGKFPSESIADKNDFIGEFLQHGYIRDVLFLSAQPETFYVIVFESQTTVNQVLKAHHCIANQQVDVEKFSYQICNSIIEMAESRTIGPLDMGNVETNHDHYMSDTDSESEGSDVSDTNTENTEVVQSDTISKAVILPFFHSEISLPVATTLLDVEFQTLIKSLGLTKQDFVERCNVIDELEMVLRKDFPNCSVTPFGSTVTGLGTSESNIDVSINNIFGDLKICVEKMRDALESSKCFVNVQIQLASDRSPTMRCTHTATYLICDISLNNEIGIGQTRLISFYLHFDQRVPLLISTVKYWAHLHQLTGLGGMKTYIISLLVIVFLTKMEIIPSVQVLKTLREKSQGKTCQSDEWDLEFCTDKAKVKEFMSLRDTYSFVGAELTSQNVLKLIKEFFDFCSRVDFNNNMICTLLCCAYPKSVFTHGQVPELPSPLDSYKKWVTNSTVAINHGKLRFNHPMYRFDIRDSFSIQDPINLSLNVSSETTPEILHRFLRLCDITSHSICHLLNTKTSSLNSIFLQNNSTDANGSQEKLLEKKSWRNACSTKSNSIKSKPKSKPNAAKQVKASDQKNWRNPIAKRVSILDFNSSSTSKNEELQMEFDRLMERIVDAEDGSANQMSFVIVEEIKMILQDSFPNYEVQHFGSTFTRLGTKNSHIDISFHQFLDSLDGTSKMQSILKLLVESKKFTYKGTVTDGLEPIWQFVHNKSRFICDMFSSNVLGVRISLLILFYLEFDSRVRPLAVLIGYMAGYRQFKNSSLVLLLLFYLMHREIIPCVRDLQIFSEERIEVDGWDTSFCADIGAVKEYYRHHKEYMTQDSMTLPVSARSVLDLAHGFFDFYASLDFKNNVLCPFLGSLIPKASFNPANANSLPSPLSSNEQFSTFKGVVMLDPFNLTRNIESKSKKQAIVKFKTFCSQAAKGFHELLRTRNKVVTLHHVINGSAMPVQLSKQ